jgi:8-oxo-dGTP diphosphatase
VVIDDDIVGGQAGSHSYRYPRPALTVDAVVFGFDEGDLKLLLIERGLDPFAGCWALPGGFVRVNETLEAAVRRELMEETGLSRVFLEQLFTFGELDRDPRERVVSVAYYALVKLSDCRLKASTDARQARWFPVGKLPKLAFDHREIIEVALRRLQGKVRYQPIGFVLLPPEFTLSQLQHLYEATLGTRLDKRNFRRKLLRTGLLAALEKRAAGRHRPAQLFRFDRKKYSRLQERGLNFEL